MSHIQFELQALDDARHVAGATGVDHRIVKGGLLDAWAHCFRHRVDVLTDRQLFAFFGADITGALVDFNFLEDLSKGSFRVRGAGRYLRIHEGRVRGAQITNEKRRKKRDDERGGERTLSDTLSERSSDAQPPKTGLSDEGAHAQRSLSARSTDAPERSSSDQRSAIQKKKDRSAGNQSELPAIEPKPKRAKPTNQQAEFVEWAGAERAKELRDSPPDVAPVWERHGPPLSEMLHGYGMHTAQSAYRLFLKDDYARTKTDPPCPLGLFVKQWSKWISAAQRSSGSPTSSPTNGAASGEMIFTPFTTVEEEYPDVAPKRR